MGEIKGIVIYVIKKDEVLLFLRDLAINPRVVVNGVPILIFCDNKLDDERFSEFFGDEWDEVIAMYNETMEKLNETIFNPIFSQALKSELVGEDLIVSVNNQINDEIDKIREEYRSFEEYIARLMVGEM